MTKYFFKSKVWKYKGKASWYFVTLPKKLSISIRKSQGLSEEGWGRLKTTAQVGQLKWSTAIWYDTKASSYLLPLKSEIRKKENIKADASIEVELFFDSHVEVKKSKKKHSTKPTMWS